MITKILIRLSILSIVVSLSSLAILAPISLAQGIVPAPIEGGTTCDELKTKKVFANSNSFKSEIKTDRSLLANALGCAVKSGDIRLFMLPFFVTYLIQFLLQIAGVVALLFVVLGGYYYVLGGLTDDKEKGKKTITHALLGLIVALSAWVIVNFIQVALTS